MATPIVTADALGTLVCEAMDIDPNRVARIILDLPAYGAATLYIQMWGSTKLLDIDWEDALKGVEVIKLSDSE